jgi:hypothetical protein
MRQLVNVVLIVLITISSISCNEDPDKTNNPQVIPKDKTKETVKASKLNLNISFLLDLSDRISPAKYPNASMEYYLRDVAYIKSVAEAFDIHLRKKRVRQMNDKMQVFFDPEPQNQNINAISDDLKFSISRQNASEELLAEIMNVYSTKPLKIYDLAIKDDAYVGSDTWRFFKNKVTDYCIDSSYRNILVVLTDGYIYHKDTKIKERNLTSYITSQDIRSYKLNNANWKTRLDENKFGFIPANDNLEELEILVLGINPNPKNVYEEDVIFKYWSDWFNQMKVGRYEIKTAGLPSNMDKIIKDFILNE